MVRELAALHQVGELYRPKNGRHLITMAFQGDDSSDRAPGGKDDFAHLELVHLRGIGIEGPGKAVGGEGVYCLVAVLHQNDVVLILNTGAAPGSNAELFFALRHVAELDGVPHQDGPGCRAET
jgi:hypothetical protein